MKYVITQTSEFNPVRVALIDEHGFHADLGEAIFGQVVGAGHMKVVNGKVEVYGSSIGLGMVSKDEDAGIIAAHLGITQ